MAVVTCLNCGAKNRVDEDTVSRLQPVCGRCETVLSVTTPHKGSSAMFRKGDVVGHYTLVHRIGRGGFGEVWLAEKTGLVTIRFALKLPKDDDIDSAIFKQEASIWVQASGHTNIVPIVEADVHSVKRDGVILRSDQIVIVSEYLRDGSLENRLQKYQNNALSTDAALEIALGILAGLKYLHTRQPLIIHRDLKPDNILLQGETPRLTDFGIARMLKTNSYSRTENITGTLPYMAPEVFKGHYSVSTDVWAAGVILYQLLSGRLPFRQIEIAALMWAIANDEPEPLSAEVPGHFRAVVYKALKKNPIERYKTADEMRQALVDAKHGRANWASTITAPPSTAPLSHFDDKKREKPEPPVPKPLPKSVWIITAVVVLLSVIAFSFYISRKPGVTASDTPSEKNTPPANTTDTPNANPQTDGNSVVGSPNINVGHVAATGEVELETDNAYPLSVSEVNAQLTQWLVKPGDFVNQSGIIAKYSYLVSPGSAATADGNGTPPTYSDGSLAVPKPSKVISISVSEGQWIMPNQELCRVAPVSRVLVKAKLTTNDLARIHIGTNAFFQTTPKNAYKGRVESVNVQEGIVKIKLFNKNVYDDRGFLTLDPEARGDVTFDVSATAK